MRCLLDTRHLNVTSLSIFVDSGGNTCIVIVRSVSSYFPSRLPLPSATLGCTNVLLTLPNIAARGSFRGETRHLMD